MIRWPGKIPAGVVSTRSFSTTTGSRHLLAAAGEPDIIEKLKKGHQVGDKTFKVHLDAYNILPYLIRRGGRESTKGFNLLLR